MNFCVFIFMTSFLYLSIESKVFTKEDLISDEKQGKQFLGEANDILAQQLNILSEVQWSYATNINDQTSEAQIKAILEFNEFQKQQSIETKRYNWTLFNETYVRQFEKLAIIGTSALEGNDDIKFITVSNEMKTIYSSAKICVDNECDLGLDQHLTELMATSKKYSELEEIWINWRNATGKLMRDKYITYYTLGNKAATLNSLPNQNFKTLDELWLFVWETTDIKEQTAALWDQLKTFYEKLHAYVRIKLEKQFLNKMPKDGTIPAHLLGNMWAQSWSNIMNTVDGVDPYPDIESIDVTQALIDKKFDARQMFELSDDFFSDLGLDRMTDIFWNKSVIERPSDGRDMVCHASAWDFYTKDDFRIKQCTLINMEDLITIHHEMGHIEYFMQYQNQPTVYRDGANPGFHEAIGDLLALSVSTPKHLNHLGLINDSALKNMTKINIKYQMKMALEKLAFLPFAFIMDKWRWDVFSGAVNSNDMNRHWWKLRLQYQGISPPVKRSENDFDPGAKYHIPASVEYIRYFVSHILQFQFHSALCDIAEPGVPLHECDINGNKIAANKLKQMLQKGSSQKWPQILKIMTGTEQIDVQPFIDYFKPLSDFLDKELSGVTLGWNANVDDYMDNDSKGGSSYRYLDTMLIIFNSVLIISLLFGY